MRSGYAALVAIAFWAAPAFCAESLPTLGMVSGPKTGTYIAFARDIADTAKKAGVKIEIKPSGGSVDNIKRINSGENAALGIVQSDVLSFLGRSQNPDTRKMASGLRMILPLYQEEVHVLTRKTITDFKQLNGKRVVVGEDGSGHMLTAVNLMAMLSLSPAQTLRVAPPEGVLALLDGEADAVIFVGGKPVKLFQNLDSLKSDKSAHYKQMLSDLHFLPLTEPRFLEEYKAAEITPQDYSFVTAPIPTIAVTAVLVTYDFSDGGKANRARCRAVHKLFEALKKDLPELQKTGHAKWKEVSAENVLPLWKKDACAWEAPPEPKAEAAKPAKKKAAKKSSRKAAKKSAPKKKLPADMRRIMYQR